VDPEEKVRAAVCKLYGGLPYEVALHHVDVASLRCVAERVQDKKVNLMLSVQPCSGR
jgi:sister-chromatid-cohesion protein PDS5